jgi:hypothetical protein
MLAAWACVCAVHHLNLVAPWPALSVLTFADVLDIHISIKQLITFNFSHSIKVPEVLKWKTFGRREWQAMATNIGMPFSKLGCDVFYGLNDVGHGRTADEMVLSKAST